MSDLDPLEIFRTDLETTKDRQLAELRDFALAGSEQPKPELIASFTLTKDLVSIQPGTSIVVKGSDTIGKILKASNRGEYPVMLVARDRSLTENTYQLLLEVGTEKSFPKIISAETLPDISPIGFFDHLDHKHGHRGGGMIKSVEAPLGHFYIDATDMIRKVARQAQEPVALRISVLADDEKGLTSRPLQLGRISLDIISR